MPNGRSTLVNEYQQSPYSSSFPTPAQPARTSPYAPRSSLETNLATGPQYFFKASPFFEIREMLLNNITLDSTT
jgi:E3 SUMO-protein ligase PIAS1